MKPPADDPWDSLRARIIGLGAGSARKSYYPELRRRLTELERFRALLDEIDEIILVIDPATGQIHDVNGSGCRRLGRERDALLALHLTDIIDPADRERIFGILTDPGIKPGQTVLLDTAVHPEGGEPLQVEMTIRRIGFGPDAQGVVVARDMTEKFNLQQRLIQSQRLEAVGTLAGGLAHDFNNLLQGVQGYAELLLLDHPPGTPGNAELSAICSIALRGGEMIRQLLTFSRQIEPKIQSVGIKELLDQVRLVLDRTIPRMIAIEEQTAAGLWKVNGDPTQIQQVLINLALNARDAMPEGGRLLFEASNITLDSNLSREHLDLPPGRYVVLSVSDTGSGMDPRTLQRIFDPFFTTKEAGRGTGLGLAMVHGIVQAHGGGILCESQLGKGTSFRVYLPAGAPKGESPGADSSEPVPKGGIEKILLVDDETSVRDVAQIVLERHGYTVLACASGEEALATFESGSQRFDLIILDLIMPGMGGKKCLEVLRRSGVQVPVVIASGFSPSGPERDAVEAGAQGFVAKPFELRALLTEVRKVLDSRDDG